MKKAVDISRNIERIETKTRNAQLNANWIEKCAKEMDILLDDDEKYKVLSLLSKCF